MSSKWSIKTSPCPVSSAASFSPAMPSLTRIWQPPQLQQHGVPHEPSSLWTGICVL